jgi:hypothetical protein
MEHWRKLRKSIRKTHTVCLVTSCQYFRSSFLRSICQKFHVYGPIPNSYEAMDVTWCLFNAWPSSHAYVHLLTSSALASTECNKVVHACYVLSGCYSVTRDYRVLCTCHLYLQITNVQICTAYCETSWLEGPTCYVFPHIWRIILWSQTKFRIWC